MTNALIRCILSIDSNCIDFLLFRVVEIHRICEATATPVTEGASLSEFYLNNKRIGTRDSSPLFVSGLFLFTMNEGGLYGKTFVYF